MARIDVGWVIVSRKRMKTFTLCRGVLRLVTPGKNKCRLQETAVFFVHVPVSSWRKQKTVNERKSGKAVPASRISRPCTLIISTHHTENR